MNRISGPLIIVLIGLLTGMKPVQMEVKLECVKRQHATRSCHYNFLVDGIPHHYVDHGCKSKREDIIRKAETGKLGLHKDWKIDCKPTPKKEN
ncbi:MAG: hypothetical protein MUE95_04715 [Cyclobacteriaceae bacterium]|jgi:hypothetical protein|nr:hypothetical protein [Cyclobacteriaceae bacterium]